MATVYGISYFYRFSEQLGIPPYWVYPSPGYPHLMLAYPAFDHTGHSISGSADGTAEITDEDALALEAPMTHAGDALEDGDCAIWFEEVFVGEDEPSSYMYDNHFVFHSLDTTSDPEVIDYTEDQAISAIEDSNESVLAAVDTSAASCGELDYGSNEKRRLRERFFTTGSMTIDQMINEQISSIASEVAYGTLIMLYTFKRSLYTMPYRLAEAEAITGQEDSTFQVVLGPGMQISGSAGITTSGVY